jgi:putative transposase
MPAGDGKPDELLPARLEYLLATFIRRRSCGTAQGILALGFFTAGLLDGTKVYVLAVIGHGSRRVRVLGATEHPVQSWVVRQARKLLMDLEDARTRVKFVLHDREAGFTAAFGVIRQLVFAWPCDN